MRTAVSSSATTTAILMRRLASSLRQRALRAERRARVAVARVPEHPAGAAALVGAADLVADLGHAEDPAVEGVVAEILQPRPHLHLRVRRPLLDEPHALAHDLERVPHRVAEPRDADVVAGGIDHRADVVEVWRQLLDPLADVGVVLVERDVA